ncbi:MAG: hypothetical protein ACFWUE_10650 [Xylanivirga thermophila]
MAVIPLVAFTCPPTINPFLPPTCIRPPLFILLCIMASDSTLPRDTTVPFSMNLDTTFPSACIYPFPIPCIPFFSTISPLAINVAPSTTPFTFIFPPAFTEKPESTLPDIITLPTKSISPVELSTFPFTS